MTDNILASGGGSDHVVPVAIENEMKKSYLDYAMSVIVARAIPDACDGLKPVHRRIMYVMHEGGYDYNKPFKKSARIVGEVMGKYHPHGDGAIYDSLVRMAQDFSMRVPLIDGQGNFGSIDDDPPAAMRYTESRLEKISHTMLEDLDKDTVDFMPNYDGAELEPKVLPARFPNLLVNGSAGIAVGMATNIPPHNLGEVIDAAIAYIDNPDITQEEVLQIVPGPDFPTGGVIMGRSGYNSAVKTGRGSVVMRGVANFEESKSGKSSIIISEIPFQVNKAKLVEKIAELVRDRKIEGITDLRDESDRDGIRVVIDLKRDAMHEVILNQLYNYTPLQSNFPINMLALNHGRPETMKLLDVLRVFCEFRKSVVTRRTSFLLNKARNRAHILIGLRVAVADIDEIVMLIRKAPDPAAARKELMARPWNGQIVAPLIDLVQDKGNVVKDGKFYFTEEQARAILDMKLAKLTGLESEKIDGELKELAAEIMKYLEILGDKEKLIAIIKREMVEIKEQFATPRLTRIEDAEFESSIEDLIPKEDMVIVATVNGYIKRVPLSTYRAQKRGGKGRSGMDVRDEDVATNIFIANTHTPVLFFSSTGKVYKLKAYKLPLGNPHSKGRALVNLLPLGLNEKISTILALSENEDEWRDLNIAFATTKGNIRRNLMTDFVNIQSNGKIAIKLNDGDSLVGVNLCDEGDDILLATRGGRCIRFAVEKLRVFKGRSSSGVRGVKLDQGNEVISMSILKNAGIDIVIREEYLKIPSKERIALKKALVEQELMSDSLLGAAQNPVEKAMKKIKSSLEVEQIKALAANEQFILTMTENGFGKRSSAYEYRSINRSGVGITNIVTSKRNGAVVASFCVNDDDQIIMITDKGTLIRMPVDNIRVAGRNTQGVTLLKTNDATNEVVVSVARIAGEDV